jgi:SAM-dependent methyltransferase
MINMNESGTEVLNREIPWFKLWFNTVHYHKLYSSRDEKEAESFIDNLLIRLQPPKGSSLLDVGCGTGRHSRYLAKQGFNVTGIDLSLNSIRQAKKLGNDFLRFYCRDMRIPFGKELFNYVFNFFTSFGYFKTYHEHNSVINNMSVALKPGGVIVLDYLNVQYSKKQLAPLEIKEIDGTVYHLTRWTDGKYFYKKIKIENLYSGESPEYTEQVAMFTLEDFKDLFEKNNLAVKDIFGDYVLSRFDPETSNRLIITAQKE